MIAPIKRNANDPRVKINGKLIKVDFRIITEELYQRILLSFKEVKHNDITNMVDIKSNVLPFTTRQFIQTFITQNNQINED